MSNNYQPPLSNSVLALLARVTNYGTPDLVKKKGNVISINFAYKGHLSPSSEVKTGELIRITAASQMTP